jgi:cystathionine beta-lyase family protein involved in aluminum resistance
MHKHGWLSRLALPAGLQSLIEESLRRSEERWIDIDGVAFGNQLRVLEALQAEKIGEEDFQDSSGYGYHDRGRDKLENAFARAFGGEAALVRTQIVSGTHALAVALFGLLRPGELLLCLTGAPYDTLQAVIGSRGEEEGTLKEWGIRFHYHPDDGKGYPDLSALEPSLLPKVAYIQRSAGYELRRSSLTIDRIQQITAKIRSLYPGAWVVVDNCYGEFVETVEPLAVGADLVVGSLIKNPGGGVAPGGGYLAGRRELVHKISARLTAPGLYGNLGAVTAKRSLFQGLFLAPTLVANALKNAVFAAALFELLGCEVWPRYDQERGDIVQAVSLRSPEKVKRFCQAIQNSSPVESHLTLEPGMLPGYADPVIMAAGTFFQGASGELSADAPMREPYAVFLQGGLTLPHALYATCRAALALWEARR